jgi:formylglycine-generating enzyme required for sulfatase activity
MRIKFAVLLQCILLCTQSVRAVNIEMVTVGNPGNAADMRLIYLPKDYGSVNYVYQIGKYEITARQYTEFLNAVAKSDPNGLYSPYMTLKYGANIVRLGTSPNFSYSVSADWADRPVDWVSFWDAVRFCNWLHNGQPTGPQGLGTTEDGAYHDVGNELLIGRNPEAKFFIPTESEWYKAGYHDKSAGLTGQYFDYPTGTSTGPGRDISEATNIGNNANYYWYGFAIGPPYYRTVVGEFDSTASPYGTFDQGGNVAEWVDSGEASSSRLIRGSSFIQSKEELHAFARGTSASKNLLTEWYDIGFRIAAAAPVPEPTSITLFSIAAMMLGGSRLRMQRA